MDVDSLSKETVSDAQLTALLNFLAEHVEVAKGLVRGRKGCAYWWNECSKILNSYSCGTNKTPKGWSKFWCDWKYRVKKRVLMLKVNQNNEAEEPPLTELERRIIQIIGEDAINSIVVKTDPLVDEHSNFYSTLEEAKKNENKSVFESRKRQKISTNNTETLDVNNISLSLYTKYKYDFKNTDDEIANEMLEIERKKLDIEEEELKCLQSIASDIKSFAKLLSDLKDNLIKKDN